MRGLAVSGTSLTTRFAPSFGTTGRALWHFVGAEAGATLTAGAFRQLDLRAAATLKGGVFELQIGYRARWIDTTSIGTIGSMFSASTASTDQAIATAPTAPALVAGPHVSIGFVF